jgi:uncharacterized protein YggE
MRTWLAMAAALAALLPTLNGAQAGPLPDYPFVYAEGAASRELPPDVGTLGFTLTGRNASSEVAIAQVQAAAGKALALLAQAGIHDADINAAQLNKTERTRWDEKTHRNLPDGFEVTRNFVVTVRELERYPALLTALLAMPGASGGGSGFDRADRARVSGELLAEATEQARRNGERLAAGLHRKLGMAHAIARIPLAEIPARFGLGGRSAGPRGELQEVMVTSQRSAEASLVPATLTISESVNVLFELQ